MHELQGHSDRPIRISSYLCLYLVEGLDLILGHGLGLSQDGSHAIPLDLSGIMQGIGKILLQPMHGAAIGDLPLLG